MNEFQQKYQAKEALHWFMKTSSLRKMINKAFKTENMNQLYTLRYFIADLIENLAHEHQQTIQSNQEYFIVYRQMKLSTDEFKQLQQNKGQLISMKGFFMANTDRSSPLTSSIEQPNFIYVMFQIECNIKYYNYFWKINL